jgi:putative transposase
MLPRMARLPRFFVPGIPLHVVQRGNNRAAMFAAAGDKAFFRGCLAHSARRHGVAVHAYALMDNHVHVLATPQLSRSLPKMMQSVGRVYVKYFNDLYGRTGTLWEGRYKAALVDSERYLLTCMRYIELNPVRAGMVVRPGDYPWSSFTANAGDGYDPLVVPHAVYESLGADPDQRGAAYRALFSGAIPDADLCAIRDATQNGWALGTAAFHNRVDAHGRRSARLANAHGRKAGPAPEKDGV